MIEFLRVLMPLRNTLTVDGLRTLDGCPATWVIGRTGNSIGIHEPPEYAQRMETLSYSFADARDRGKADILLLTLRFESPKAA